MAIKISALTPFGMMNIENVHDVNYHVEFCKRKHRIEDISVRLIEFDVGITKYRIFKMEMYIWRSDMVVSIGEIYADTWEEFVKCMREFKEYEVKFNEDVVNAVGRDILMNI